jgi:U1 small nuclear ribonucleoprotein
MPGTHLLPPNLLKLFAPRPPLLYTRPLDRDIDRVRPKHVDGVAGLLARLNEEKDAAIAQGGAQADAVAAEGMEEGEEPTFTLAEEVKREMRREERKKLKADKFKQQKESCACWLL